MTIIKTKESVIRDLARLGYGQDQDKIKAEIIAAMKDRREKK